MQGVYPQDIDPLKRGRMKISSITLHNFRCFEDATFHARDYALLVGANNAGKSNLIDALRIFYEKDLKFEDGRDFPRFPATDKDSWIDITYRLTSDEYDNLKTEYRQPGKQLKVRKYLKSVEKDSDGKPRAGIFGYEGSVLSAEHFYGMKNVQQGKLGDLIYIPDVSVLSDHTKMSGPSALRDLVTDILKKLVKKSPSFQSLTTEFGAFAKTLKTELTDEKHSLAGLESDVNEAIREWGTSFELNINPISETDLVKNLVSFKILDQALNEKFEAGQFGQGFQRHLVYTFIRLAARYQTPTAKTKKKEFAPALTLLLFEEPEAFLHPHQVKQLSIDLMAIASGDDHQVIASTHSPAFVSPNTDDIAAIARLRRVNGRTEIGQITEDELSNLFKDNQRINVLLTAAGRTQMPDDLTEDMEVIKYFLWLNSERCAAFFANHVVLVEGPTEQVLINHLISKKALQAPSGGVFVLDCIGKYNIHRFMNLLGRLRIGHSALYDGDNGKPVDQAVAKAIAESRNPFTLTVEVMPHDLEAFLQIPPAGKPNRKPQHVLLTYEKGQVAQERIDAFVEVLKRLLPVDATPGANDGTAAVEAHETVEEAAAT